MYEPTDEQIEALAEQMYYGVSGKRWDWGGYDATDRTHRVYRALAVEHVESSAFQSIIRAAQAEVEDRFIDWFRTEVNYPFDVSFDVPPPLNHRRLASEWNKHDGWDISDDDAFDVIRSEAYLDNNPHWKDTP